MSYQVHNEKPRVLIITIVDEENNEVAKRFITAISVDDVLCKLFGPEANPTPKRKRRTKAEIAESKPTLPSPTEPEKSGGRKARRIWP